MKLALILTILVTLPLAAAHEKKSPGSKDSLSRARIKYEPKKAEKFRKKLKVKPKGCEYAKDADCPEAKVDP